VGRRKELPFLEKVRITDIGAEGNALARVDNLVVFVPMLIPGDIVDIRLLRKERNIWKEELLSFMNIPLTGLKHDVSILEFAAVVSGSISRTSFSFSIKKSR